MRVGKRSRRRLNGNAIRRRFGNRGRPTIDIPRRPAITPRHPFPRALRRHCARTALLATSDPVHRLWRPRAIRLHELPDRSPNGLGDVTRPAPGIDCRSMRPTVLILICCLALLAAPGLDRLQFLAGHASHRKSLARTGRHAFLTLDSPHEHDRLHRNLHRCRRCPRPRHPTLCGWPRAPSSRRLAVPLPGPIAIGVAMALPVNDDLCAADHGAGRFALRGPRRRAPVQLEERGSGHSSRPPCAQCSHPGVGLPSLVASVIE